MTSYPRATMPTSFKERRVGNTQEARRAARGNGGGVISFIRGPSALGGGNVRRGSPFHSRTSALCDSWEWRGWAGYLAASSYSLVPEMEYYAIRHSAGLLDVSPLYKYLITGRSEEHTSELQSHVNLVCRLLLEKKKKKKTAPLTSYKNRKKNQNNIK